jgi:hypothetical protein
VNLRCYFLSLLKIHHPGCEVCNAREISGAAMRRRLEELNWRRQHSVNDRDDEVEFVDSKRTAEGVASSPLVNVKKEMKKSA